MPPRPEAPPTPVLLSLLLEQALEYAIFFTDPEGTVTDWFPGAEQIFGFTADEIVGESALRLFNQEDIAKGAARHELELAARIGRAEDDRWHVRKDGTLFWGSGATVALRDGAGKLVAFAKLARNRTDVKTQSDALENRVRALTQREEQHRAFLAILAHEMRNPLAPITNALGLIKMAGTPNPTTEKALQVIERQMSLLSRLVDDLMENTRVATGKVSLQRGVLNLREVLEATASAARPDAEGRRQTLQCSLIGSDVPVMGDAQRLNQVFANLLNNAIKYTPEGGRIVLALTTEGGDAVARVEDTGVGMSAEILPRVFDLFTQEAASSEMAAGGLGLGLSLVRDLVAMHGGTVQAKSDGRGKGSVFTVRLPIHGATQT